MKIILTRPDWKWGNVFSPHKKYTATEQKEKHPQLEMKQRREMSNFLPYIPFNWMKLIWQMVNYARREIGAVSLPRNQSEITGMLDMVMRR